MRNKLIKICLYSPALFPILSIGMVSIVIILFSLGSCVNFGKKKSLLLINFNKHYKIILILSAPFLLYLLSLLWSGNISHGLSFVSRTSSFIIFPVVLFVFKPFRNVIQVEKFIKIFVFCGMLLSFFSILFISVDVLMNEEINSLGTMMNLIRSRIGDVPIVGEHPTYFSLILSTSFILLMFYKFKNSRLNIFMYIILLAGIMFSLSRSGLILIFLILFAQLFIVIKNKKIALASVVGLIFTVGLFVLNSPMKERFGQLVNTKHFYPQGIHYNSFNLRTAIYRCSFLIAKETSLYGYGAGNVQQKLDDCYHESYNTEAFNKITYNTHNQYLHFWLSFGILGFLAILISFIYFLKMSFLYINNAYLFFLIFFYLSFLTENILSRNTGIVLFSMFNSLFVFTFYIMKQYRLPNKRKYQV